MLGWLVGEVSCFLHQLAQQLVPVVLQDLNSGALNMLLRVHTVVDEIDPKPNFFNLNMHGYYQGQTLAHDIECLLPLLVVDHKHLHSQLMSDGTFQLPFKSSSLSDVSLQLRCCDACHKLLHFLVISVLPLRFEVHIYLLQNYVQAIFRQKPSNKALLPLSLHIYLNDLQSLLPKHLPLTLMNNRIICLVVLFIEHFHILPQLILWNQRVSDNLQIGIIILNGGFLFVTLFSVLHVLLYYFLIVTFQ